VAGAGGDRGDRYFLADDPCIILSDRGGIVAFYVSIFNPASFLLFIIGDLEFIMSYAIYINIFTL
jgi:hypothetical protein